MAHPYVEAFEARLRDLLYDVDHLLEARHPELYPRHPNRPAQGETASPQYDGLFAVSGAFSAGIGSEHGPGYVLEIRIATLASVSAETKRRIQDEAVLEIRKRFPKFFPARRLDVVRDGDLLKVVGDLGVRPVDERVNE